LGHKKNGSGEMFKNLEHFRLSHPSVSAPSGCDTAWTGTCIIITAKTHGGKGELALSPSWLYLSISFSKEKEFSTLKKISLLSVVRVVSALLTS
jgi:hypothetical protein